MPTYDYQCSEGHRFELFQRISDEPLAKCPECGARAQRVISGGAGFLFRGDGFYITDYRSEDYRKKASAEQGGAGEGKGAAKSGGAEASKAGKPGGAPGSSGEGGGSTGSGRSGGSARSEGPSASGGSKASSDS